MYLLPEFINANKKDQIPVNSNWKFLMWKPRDVDIDDESENVLEKLKF